MRDLNSQEVSNFCRSKKGDFYTQDPNIFSASNVFSLEKLNDFEAEFYLIVHKGLIQEIQVKYFAQLSGRSEVAFANDVFIIFYAKGISNMGNGIKSFFSYAIDQLKTTEEQNPVIKVNSGSRFCSYIGNNTVLTETYFGRKIFLDSQDISLSPHIMYEGRWEQWVTDFFIKNLKAGDVFFDIGANCGFYTLLAAHHVGQTGFVLALEPQRKLRSLIENSIEINGFSGFSHVIETAVGEIEGEAQLGHYKNLKGSSTLFPGFGDSGENVKVAPLPAIIRYTEELFNRVLTPNVIKIDVEGYEYFVWKGAREYLKEIKNILILLEFTPDRYIQLGQDPEIFINELMADGFQITQLTHNGTEKEFTSGDIERVIDSGDYADLVLRKV